MCADGYHVDGSWSPTVEGRALVPEHQHLRRRHLPRLHLRLVLRGRLGEEPGRAWASRYVGRLTFTLRSSDIQPEKRPPVVRWHFRILSRPSRHTDARLRRQPARLGPDTGPPTGLVGQPDRCVRRQVQVMSDAVSPRMSCPAGCRTTAPSVLGADLQRSSQDFGSRAADRDEENPEWQS
jgi:hypothetical protein